MSYIYTSNSPEYLAYIASVYTRDEIKNNPRLCVLLENPYIKDNMELALSHREAELGGIDEKRNFIENETKKMKKHFIFAGGFAAGVCCSIISFVFII